MKPPFRLDDAPAQRLIAALIDAVFAFGRLSQLLQGHKLLPAILYRARLEAARRCAAVDGAAIDPWSLAALLAGLRLPLGQVETIAERGAIFAAARHAMGVHRWLADPDFDQEGDIQLAEAMLAERAGQDPWRAAATTLRDWVEVGRPRMAIRAAIVRHWQRRGVMPPGVPLVGAASLMADETWDLEQWLPAFYRTLANEADEIADLASRLDHAWRQARFAIQGYRRSSHAPALVDLLAAAPMLSSPAVAAMLDIAPKNAIRLLEELQADGIIIEVSRRAKRRLYALPDMAPLRDGVAAPKRPEFGRGRGRPPATILAPDMEEAAPLQSTPAAPIGRFHFDYGGLDAAMAELEATTRKTRSALDALFQKDGALS
jgi:biotin operon repressor